MTRNVASTLAFATAVAAAAVAAAIVSSSAYADDITVDNTPFASARSRPDVRAELMRQPELVRAGASEWSMQLNQVPQLKSTLTREQARSTYKFSRDEAHALTAEDSGSAYFGTSGTRVNARATMGGPAR